MSLVSIPVEAFQKAFSVVVLAFGGAHVLRRIKQAWTQWYQISNRKKMLEKWAKEAPENVVILHVFPRAKRIPNPSPFGLKLETYLRMAEIPYEVDTTSPKGEKDKSPWITLNGKHYTDSQIIIEVLNAHFCKDLDSSYNKTELAIGTMARIMLEEHMFWGLLLWRYVYSDKKYLNELFPYPSQQLEEFKRLCTPKYEKFSWYQGIGRHSQNQVIKLMCEDLRAVSLFLGDKQFLLGDEPCSDDAAVFGMMAQCVWADTDSPYHILIAESLKNLDKYCERMRNRHWPDWEELAIKSQQ